MSAALLQAEPDTFVQLHARSHPIRTGMAVLCQDGTIGRVAGLVPIWSQQPTHMVVQTGPVVPQEIALPLKWVAQVTRDQVLLHVRRRQVGRILPHVTDDLLRADVREALCNTPTFRTGDAFLHINVAVHDHVVTLHGNVQTSWRALLAETIAHQVRGVWAVQNHLIGDDEVEDRVLLALRREHRIERPTLYVQAQFGHVTLRGQVRTAADAALAVLAAKRVPGVRGVNNELVVRGAAHREPSQMIDEHMLRTARRAIRAGTG